MLLLHQAGSVKIGEVIRYTLTYTPAHDRILPSPSVLHLKIKNTSAIALRAAFVHGPYTLYVATYPFSFDPNNKWENPRRDGVPEFEPNLKAGGSFSAQLRVPENVRATAGLGDGDEEETQSVSWIIEVSSQIIFSNSAAVHYEVLLGRDEKSLTLGVGNGSMVGGGSGGGFGLGTLPGQVSDHQQSQRAKEGRHNAQVKGVYSRALRLRADDTASLWNTPKMPEWDDLAAEEGGAEESKDAPVEKARDDESKELKGKVEEKTGRKERKGRKRKKVHLVVLTHGLHSNLGADMLYLKESIDRTAAKTKIEVWKRREKRRGEKGEPNNRGNEDENSQQGGNVKQENINEDDDEEEVVVRGFSGNAVRTERGIKYLGKRMAKYILTMTYPDQPYRPVTKKSAAEALSHALRPDQAKPPSDLDPTHKDSTIHKEPFDNTSMLAYKITSISFVAHSLGGLVQTYAVAYIQKHSPQFFELIKPINFIALASPFLGLSNENPLYVKFALDFGLVGRTGQDLGLTWRAPTLARSGWGAIVSGIGESAHKRLDGETAPEAKPLLRILPTGPAHTVLKKFKNRTIYSNVVNDGVVPLRTSCLLFLDWQGLGRVEKARRENGLVGTVLEWGWAEVTGQNSSSSDRRQGPWSDVSDSDTAGNNTPTREGHGGDVPQPPADAIDKDDTRSMKHVERPKSGRSSGEGESDNNSPLPSPSNTGPLASLMSFFKPNNNNNISPPQQPQDQYHKSKKIYKRSQTLTLNDISSSSQPSISTSSSSPTQEASSKGPTSQLGDPSRLSAPPKTTFFEAAGDLLKPPLPSVEFLIDPASRPLTIFHDRVYNPENIPQPLLKKRTTSGLMRKSRQNTPSSINSNNSNTNSTNSNSTFSPPLPSPASSNLSSKDYDDTIHTGPSKMQPKETIDASAMKVEEKIARAYHRDLSWRKVLVSLKPDAHNNMIVRRMFANAYGWPVVRHLCEMHFGLDDEEDGDRGRESNTKEKKEGLGVRLKADGDTKATREGEGIDIERTVSETREATDKVPALLSSLSSPQGTGFSSKTLGNKPSFDRGYSSGGWSDGDWADSEEDSDEDEKGSNTGRGSSRDGKKDGEGQGKSWSWTEAIAWKGAVGSPKGTSQGEIGEFLWKGGDGAEDGGEEGKVKQEDRNESEPVGGGCVGC